MNLHQDFKTVKQVLIEQRWMFNRIQNRKSRMYIQRKINVYTKKDQSSVQSFNQHSFSKIYYVIGTGNDVKQMETLRDMPD